MQLQVLSGFGYVILPQNLIAPGQKSAQNFSRKKLERRNQDSEQEYYGSFKEQISEVSCHVTVCAAASRVGRCPRPHHPTSLPWTFGQQHAAR
eukprot:6213417-Pleurochrysis_carterae.AAC.3